MAMELLSPAGSWESMVAAVRTGADAGYIGAGTFHARRHATGFSLCEQDEHSLFAAVRYCHERGVAVHAALNVLVTERELSESIATARQVVKAGVDAIIVQDRGLARALHSMAPAVPLHASTQLSCHTPQGVDLLKADGFSRVVLAREMTQAEIAACVSRGVEIEVFVHGALCMSVSGQCEFSALLGGRSGNRGLCAQPCRLPCAVGKRPQEEAVLSLKDNSLLSHIPALQRMGVTSLKIEGRMKRPEYVAAATAAFRRALDGDEVDGQLNSDLQSVFSRNGFTDGYFTGHRDVAMFGTRRYEDVTAGDNRVLSRLSRLYEKETGRVAVTACLTVQTDVPVTLTLSDGVHTVTVTGAIPERAVKVPLTAQTAAAQLQKTGGTPFAVTDVTCHIDEGSTVALSSLNALRREGIARLSEARKRHNDRSFSTTLPPVIPLPNELLHGLVARVSDVSQINGTADYWVVPMGSVPAVSRWGVEIPRGLFGTSDAVLAQLKQDKKNGASFALCGTVDGLALAIAAELTPVAGWSMHITNSGSLSAAAQQGCGAAVLSFELKRSQLRFAYGQGCVGMFAYGRQPLMLMRNCPVRAAIGCDGCGKRGSITDRKGVTFPVQCRGGCAELLNSVPLYLADRLTELDEWPFLYLHFTDETPERVAQVVDEYRRGGTPPRAFTRGLYDKGWAK